MRKVYFWLGIAFSAAALWLTFRDVNWAVLANTLAGANYVWMIPSALALLAAMAARAERWRWLLGGRKSVRFSLSFDAVSIGYFVTNVFPFRLGELVRPIVIARDGTVSAVQALSTIAVEHVLDVLVLLALLVVTLPGLPLPPELVDAARRGGLVFGLAAAIMVVVVWQRARVERMTLRVLTAAPRVNEQVWMGRIRSALDGLNLVRSPRLFVAAVGWTIASWLLSALTFYFALLAFVPDATLVEGLFVTVTTTLALLVPSSPGYIGVLELVIQQSLAIFGVSATVALAYALAFHLMEFLVMNTAGVIGLVREDLSWSTMVAIVRGTGRPEQAPAVDSP